MSRDWTKSEIEELLAKRGFTYQNVKLPFGLETGGTDRTGTARAIFPGDMTDKSVFDLGCMYGFFSFEAESLGATKILGVDIEPINVESSTLLGEIRGSKVEFRQLDIETQPVPGSFDYVLCLNVLHHMRNPLNVLEKLIEATRECLVLEIATLGQGDRRKLGVSALSAAILRHFPIMYVSSGVRKKKSSNELFFFTPSAIENLLTKHRRVFSKIDVQPTNHKNGRFVVVAHKLRIDNMIVVAGPTSSGKSTLIENLRQARAPEVARALGISDMADWIAADMSMLSELGKSGKRNLILHYDITRRQFGNPIARSQYDLHDLIGIANKVTFLTIQVPQETLLLQHEEGVIKPQTKGGRFTGNVKHAKIARMYRRRDVVDSLYEQWFRIASRYEGAHFTVPSSDSSNVTKFSLQST